ncbi:hypothetical protein V6N13_001571 [Hibiscus sabdariffa]
MSQHSGPPALVEFVAIEKFLVPGWSRYYRLIVESDCKTVVDWLSEKVNPTSVIANQVLNFVEGYKRHGMVFRWAPRKCNIRADELAKQGIG